ncbi:MAG: hypothetical protein AAF790_11465 [Planctomycetota bacterium]
MLGIFLAGVAAVFSCGLAALLYFALGGRLPMRTAASFAGAAAGAAGWSVLSSGPGPAFGPPLPIVGLAAVVGSLGGVIAVSMLPAAVRHYRPSTGPQAGRFLLRDLLFFTAWSAVVLAVYRFTIAVGPGSTRDAFVGVAVVVAMLVAEGAYRLCRLQKHRRRGFSVVPPTRGEAAEVHASWRARDKTRSEGLPHARAAAPMVPRETTTRPTPAG